LFDKSHFSLHTIFARNRSAITEQSSSVEQADWQYQRGSFVAFLATGLCLPLAMLV
jgi:hypothetical protein